MIFMFFSKKNASKQAYRRETNELKRQIELSKTAILSAQLRYQFLLRRLKKRELQEV